MQGFLYIFLVQVGKKLENVILENNLRINWK